MFTIAACGAPSRTGLLLQTFVASVATRPLLLLLTDAVPDGAPIALLTASLAISQMCFPSVLLHRILSTREAAASLIPPFFVDPSNARQYLKKKTSLAGSAVLVVDNISIAYVKGRRNYLIDNACMEYRLKHQRDSPSALKSQCHWRVCRVKLTHSLSTFLLRKLWVLMPHILKHFCKRILIKRTTIAVLTIATAIPPPALLLSGL